MGVAETVLEEQIMICLNHGHTQKAYKWAQNPQSSRLNREIWVTNPHFYFRNPEKGYLSVIIAEE